MAGDKGYEPVSEEVEQAVAGVIEAAFRVHRALGPGLLESVYETCVCHELTKMGVPFERQVSWPIEYDGIKLDGGLRMDLLVDGTVVVELKAVDDLQTVHEAQLLTYMKLTGSRVGLLVNFNVHQLKDGLRRRVL
jgi:GxxExxY protein